MIDKIKDTDTHFIIDGSTRLVKNESETKSMLVQYDHNSERFTFRVPRYCDDHDLSLCKEHTRVHYINIDKAKRTENHGTDPVYDVGVCPEDDQYVICSWLITKNATQLAGSLHFVIEFALKDENGNTLYSWNTAKYTGITIQDGINFDNRTVEENNDLLTQWEKRIFENQIVSLEQTQVSDAPEGENIWTATFGNGDKSNLIVKNGARGYVGSIETVQKQPLHFFAGTRAEYDALPDEKKENLFAVFEDEAPIGNPVRASMVYKGLGDIVDVSCTTEELFKALPFNSNVSFTVNTNDTPVYLTDLPNKNSVGNNYAFVTLYKGFTVNYCYGLAWDIYGDMYFYKYHSGTAMDKNGWHKIYTDADEGVPGVDEGLTATMVKVLDFYLAQVTLQSGRIYFITVQDIEEAQDDGGSCFLYYTGDNRTDSSPFYAGGKLYRVSYAKLSNGNVGFQLMDENGVSRSPYTLKCVGMAGKSHI